MHAPDIFRVTLQLQQQDSCRLLPLNYGIRKSAVCFRGKWYRLTDTKHHYYSPFLLFLLVSIMSYRRYYDDHDPPNPFQSPAITLTMHSMQHDDALSTDYYTYGTSYHQLPDAACDPYPNLDPSSYACDTAIPNSDNDDDAYLSKKEDTSSVLSKNNNNANNTTAATSSIDRMRNQEWKQQHEQQQPGSTQGLFPLCMSTGMPWDLARRFGMSIRRLLLDGQHGDRYGFVEMQDSAKQQQHYHPIYPSPSKQWSHISPSPPSHNNMHEWAQKVDYTILFTKKSYSWPIRLCHFEICSSQNCSMMHDFIP